MLLLLFPCVCLFAIFIGEYLKRCHSPYAELKKAIKKGHVKPYYQPVVNEEGTLTGVEILARWIDPKKGFVPPDKFIPIAENENLLIPMTSLLLRTAATELPRYVGLEQRPLHIGINIAAANCKNDTFIQDCVDFMSHFPDNTITLVAEITERQPLALNDEERIFFDELYNIGVQIALDDFGTGFSSISYLDAINVQYLKIDKSFIDNLSSEQNTWKLVECIIDIADKFDLTLIAEGVETQFQSVWLKEHSIKYQQGYLYSKPLCIQDLAKQWLC